MPTQLERDLKTAEQIAKFMDSNFRIPGTRIAFGWDALIGLIPGAGDTVSALPLFYFLFVGWRHRIPKRYLLVMAGRQILDLLVGTVPLIGDLLDIAYRSNQLNARTLREQLSKKLNNAKPDA